MFPAFLTNRLSGLTAEGRRGAAGFGWTALSQVAGLILRLAGNLILTRLLAPEAFGIIGTALAVMTTLEWLSDLGVLPAIMRHPRKRDADVLCSGWWLGIARGGGLCAAGIINASALSGFLNQPALQTVLTLIALRPLLMSLRSPGMPLLRMNLNYRSVFFDELAMTVVGTATSIITAYFIPNVYAVVIGMLAGSATGILSSYILAPTAIRRWDRKICGELWSFGLSILINTMMMAFWMNLDRLLGLRILSETQMGIYAIAWNLSMVVEAVLNRGCDVHFSMLTRADTEQDRLTLHNRLMGQITKWGIPPAALLICAAPAVIRFLYDTRYAAAQLPFLILLCRVVVRGIGQLQFQLLLSEGRIRLGTIAYALALVTQASLFIPLTAHFGINGLATSALISTCVVTGTQAILSSRNLNQPLLPVSRALSWTVIPLLIVVCFPLVY